MAFINEQAYTLVTKKKKLFKKKILYLYNFGLVFLGFKT